MVMVFAIREGRGSKYRREGSTHEASFSTLHGARPGSELIDSHLLQSTKLWCFEVMCGD
jgi:hypothetical protein